MKIVFYVGPDKENENALTTRIVEVVEDAFDEERGIGGPMTMIALAMCVLSNASMDLEEYGARKASPHPRVRATLRIVRDALDALAATPGLGNVHNVFDDSVVVREHPN